LLEDIPPYRLHRDRDDDDDDDDERGVLMMMMMYDLGVF